MDAYLLRPAVPKRPSGLMAILNRTTDAMQAAADAARTALPAIGWLQAASTGSRAYGHQQATAVAAAASGSHSGLTSLGYEPPVLRAAEHGGGSVLEADAARVDDERR